MKLFTYKGLHLVLLIRSLKKM